MITSTTITVPIQTLPANADGYYYLAYDADTKMVKACRFVTGATRSPFTLEGFLTWVEVQARAAELELTGLSAHDPAGDGD